MCTALASSCAERSRAYAHLAALCPLHTSRHHPASTAARGAFKATCGAAKLLWCGWMPVHHLAPPACQPLWHLQQLYPPPFSPLSAPQARLSLLTPPLPFPTSALPLPYFKRISRLLGLPHVQSVTGRWEIWTGAEPFQGVSLHALLHHVSSGAGPSLAIPGTQQWEEEHCSDGGDDEVPQEPGPGWGDLMQRCWAHTPQDRPSCDEVQLTLEAMLNTLRSARRPSMDVRPASYSTQTSPLNKPQEAQGHVTAPAARVPQP